MKRILLSLFVMAAWTAALHAAPWPVDKTHSLVGFTARHMMVSNVHGEFTNYEATVDFDPANPTAHSNPPRTL